MEWPWDADKRSKLKDKVALIQLASERKVGLFHISLHEGDTVDDLIAPSLKAIIESSKIIKAGVAIMKADFSRLKTYFNLEPKGAFELSHLYNLVAYGPTNPRRVTTRLHSLSGQVEQHLGLPLWKGDVRTSDWSRPLTFSQTHYAANDVYAGYMLFHCMNAKRLAMDPVPPFPSLHETYPVSTAPKSTLVRLESVTEDGEIRIVTAVEFFAPEQSTEGGKRTEATSSVKNSNQKSTPRKESKLLAIDTGSAMNSSCWALYCRLVDHRTETAGLKKLTPFIIAHNATLKALSVYRPLTKQELLRVPGVGKGKLAEYGAAWLEIITAFVAEQKQSGDQEGQKDPAIEIDGRDSKRRKIDSDMSRPEETPIASEKPATVLSIGPLPQVGETNTASELPAPPQPKARYDSDEYDGDSVFDSPIDLPPPLVLKRKTPRRKPRQRRPPTVVQVSKSVPKPPFPVKVEPAPELPPIRNPGLRLPRRPTSKPASISTLTRSRALTASRLQPQMPPRRLTSERALLKRKLEAYIKSVVHALRPAPTEPLASESMLQYLVTTVPRTIEEFRRVPGMQRLMKACGFAKMDVWREFEKWTRNLRANPQAAPQAAPRVVPRAFPRVIPNTRSIR
ncbi:hypothetical protein F5Y10DRAFT_230768 [Nemania abortiva]|nr:hypothetical protein F5Y10DRAFT_230768 [Nemania abortiva]